MDETVLLGGFLLIGAAGSDALVNGPSTALATLGVDQVNAVRQGAGLEP